MTRSGKLCAVLVTAAALALAGSGRSEEKAAAPDFESYQLVLLRRGPKWTPEKTPEVMALQAEHIAHLTRMGESGKLVIAGPLSDQEDETVRGVCLYRVGSIAEARALAEADPAVKAGRLRVEAMTWHVEKGYMTFPKAPPVK